jgi:histone H3/H4
MKITSERLKEIIKEEFHAVNEQEKKSYSYDGGQWDKKIDEMYAEARQDASGPDGSLRTLPEMGGVRQLLGEKWADKNAFKYIINKIDAEQFIGHISDDYMRYFQDGIGGGRATLYGTPKNMPMLKGAERIASLYNKLTDDNVLIPKEFKNRKEWVAGSIAYFAKREPDIANFLAKSHGKSQIDSLSDLLAPFVSNFYKAAYAGKFSKDEGGKSAEDLWNRALNSRIGQYIPKEDGLAKQAYRPTVTRKDIERAYSKLPGYKGAGSKYDKLGYTGNVNRTDMSSGGDGTGAVPAGAGMGLREGKITRDVLKALIKEELTKPEKGKK